MQKKTYRGIVEQGIKQGTALGFPTVNIPLNDPAISGIYAARVRVEDKEYQAAVFANQERNILEAYLLDFSGELYGREIEITLEKKLRETKTFETEETLRAAIADDVEKVRGFFKQT